MRKVLHWSHVFHVPVAGDADEGPAVFRCRWDGMHPGRGGEGEIDGLEGWTFWGEERVAVVVC